MKPEMDRLFQRSRRTGGSFGLGTDWSWGPQFASEKGRSWEGSTGYLTNDSRFELGSVEKEMPKLDVPLRY